MSVESVNNAIDSMTKEINQMSNQLFKQTNILSNLTRNVNLAIFELEKLNDHFAMDEIENIIKILEDGLENIVKKEE